MIARWISWFLFAIPIGLLGGNTQMALAARPADPLLKLVPRDAGATLVVEDLRGATRAVLGSEIVAGFRKLPAVREWLASEKFRQFEAALHQLEKALGENVATLRDGLLGEAFVLTLRVPPGGLPDEARGLLLIRVPDQPLLDRLIASLNAAQARSGELKGVSERTRRGIKYKARDLLPAGRDQEFFAILDGRVFAWSNSEALIQGVIDQQAGMASGLDEHPDFQEVRQGLPPGAVVSLFVDPEFVAGLFRLAEWSPKPEDEALFRLLGQLASTLKYAGAALEWRDGPVLHAREILDPDKFGPTLSQWAAKATSVEPFLRRVPATAMAIASVAVDPRVLFDTLVALVPSRDRVKLENLLITFDGILLGRNARDEVAARLGPGAVAYVERPDPTDRAAALPVVCSIQAGGDPLAEEARIALRNGLRTILAVHALNTKGAELRLETLETTRGAIVATVPSSPFAFATMADRIVLGTSRQAVARALAAEEDPRAGEPFARFRRALFPLAKNFACVDLHALGDFATKSRLALTRRIAARQNRPLADVGRELDQAIALIGEFDAAFLAATAETGFRVAHQTLGLVRLQKSGAPGP